MTATIRSSLSAFAGGLAFGLALITASAAWAAGCGCTPTPPTPPTPPHHPCCQPPGPPGNTTTVNVNVTTLAGATANSSASALAGGSASGAVYSGGGGGGGGYMGPGATGFIQNLNVVGAEARRTAYESSRTLIKKVVIQATCIDDKDVPHPASQVFPDRDVEDGYEGEVYRCIAGTRMQYVFAEYNGQIIFDHGQTVTCAKAEALYHSPGGKLECRAQKPARDCNERSLLRRFGAGVKILSLMTIERRTDYREERESSSTVGAISLDGGVGGMVY